MIITLIIICTVLILLAILYGFLNVLYILKGISTDIKKANIAVNVPAISQELCNRCPYSAECKEGERPGSGHCFAVLHHLDPLKVGNII
jgi:hypothetical protein